MSDKRVPPDRRETTPRRRAELAPISQHLIDDGEPTLVACPLCARAGMVTAEVAVAFARMALADEDRR